MRLLLIGTAAQLRRLPKRLPAGVLVQLRDKTLETNALYEAACDLAERGVRFVVNGRADVARAAGAAGVHLPVRGLPADAIRRWWPGALIGCSTHDVDEVRAAVQAGADYLTGGPPYPTGDKTVIELAGLRGLCEAADQTPVYALGGVTAERAKACVEVGAAGVACIRAVWDSSDPATAIAELLDRVKMRAGGGAIDATLRSAR
jgi:thiamine-phosphate pyrophosphorylase